MKCKSVVLALCMFVSLGSLAACGSSEEAKPVVSGEVSVEKSADLLKEQEILPIGTVVKLKTGTDKLMINGYLHVELKDKNKLYDYSGVKYPEGQLNTEESYLFDTDQIERVYYMGYSSDEQKELNQKIKQLKKENGK